MKEKKPCSRCRVLKPLCAFGADNRNANGLNVCCKLCLKEKWTAVRASEPPRLSPKEQVVAALRRGARRQPEIRSLTRLTEDELTDALADLYDQNQLCKASLRQRQYRLRAA